LFPLLNYGNAQQQETYINKLITGRLIGGHAITEFRQAPDLTALAMTAVQTGEGFLLNGQKRYITNTPIADMLVVYARLDNKLSASSCIVTIKEPTFMILPKYPAVSATMGDVILENALIPHSRQLAKPVPAT